MTERYYKEYSVILQRDMEYKVFGDGGQLCLGFPPQNGRFFDLENFGIVASLSQWIDSGRIQVVCVDGIDAETWSAEGGDPAARIELHERWYRYVTEELLPTLRTRSADERRAMTFGCSMGAMHAVNFLLRRPDLFGAVVGMSGVYNAQFFFRDYMDGLVYLNSPIHYVPNMPKEHPYLEAYKGCEIVLCVGQGAWEGELLASTRELDAIFREKGIAAWVDYWGKDVAHDWCWWLKQAPYFFGKLLG